MTILAGTWTVGWMNDRDLDLCWLPDLRLAGHVTYEPGPVCGYRDEPARIECRLPPGHDTPHLEVSDGLFPGLRVDRLWSSDVPDGWR